MGHWGGYAYFGRIAWRAAPGWSVVAIVAVVIAALAPIGAVYAIGAVVREVGAAGRAPAWWALAAGALFLLQWAASAVHAAAATALGERADAVLQRDLMAAVMAPDGVSHLEDPTAVDLIDVGRDTFRSAWSRPGRVASALAGLVAGRVMLLGACVVVTRF